jgi:hypothetical protein
VHKINSAAPGDTVYIDLAPICIIVDVKSMHGSTFRQGECFSNEDVQSVRQPEEHYQSVPIKIQMMNSKNKTIKNMVYRIKIFNKVVYSPPGVDLMFASTYDKAQGKTMKKTILCLHKNPFTEITLAKLYVAFTRVKKSSDLRVWPMADLNLERLKALRHPIELRLLQAAYDNQGNFKKELYMAAYKQICDAEGVESMISTRKRNRQRK